MYNARHMKAMSQRFREASLFRIQYQTRRDMMMILRNIRQYRLNKNLLVRNPNNLYAEFYFVLHLKKLGTYVEEVMGDVVVLKTDRIMPWKFEFINEVYNTYALALSEQYYVPKNFRPSSLLCLLRHVVYKPKNPPNFVFGDQSTYLHPKDGHTKRLKQQENMSRSKNRFNICSNLLIRLEKRLVFAKYSIEKCYLLHQIANTHLQSGRYNECCSVARKAIEGSPRLRSFLISFLLLHFLLIESKNCNSWLWNLLATIIIIKSNASLGKAQATKLAIENGIHIAKIINCDRLIDFFQLCHSYEYRISSKGSVQVSNRDSN